MIKYFLLRSFRKYGLTGILLLIISIFSIFIGLYIVFQFCSTLSTSFTIAKNANQIDNQTTQLAAEFMSGVVGTIWSFAGVILFFLALRLQSKELSLQLQELKDTRNVFTTQQFESTFFNLLKTQNDIRQGIVYQVERYNELGQKDNPTIYNSQTAFTEIKKFMFTVRENLNKNLKKVENFLAEEHTEEEKKEYLEKFEEVHLVKYDNIIKNPKLSAKVVYKETFDKFDNQLGHYFRNLYHILLYLKESEETEIGLELHDQMLGKKLSIIINEEDIEVQKIKKKYSKYSDFVQAQMSASELYLLFYNCLFFSKMKRLVQYYQIVGNLSADDLLFPNHDNQLYPEIEYKGELIPKLELSTRNQTLKI
ncbi:putative phage abortive infection protein [Flavobacterium geliluteum]|uniref:Phage abortive infection protein n=1 Tax=Flavobacterium geliluteum TaxID=2816120 RepID=A0A940X7R8_9FLAO|nr:putative phage abortive infection protein [Flavobacterium geliluteum]MBP4139923.1 hypothetical protein [Flavobacterium geliluteum]